MTLEQLRELNSWIKNSRNLKTKNVHTWMKGNEGFETVYKALLNEDEDVDQALLFTLHLIFSRFQKNQDLHDLLKWILIIMNIYEKTLHERDLKKILKEEEEIK